MPDFDIKLVRISLEPEILQALSAALKASGMPAGTFMLGPDEADPNCVKLFWFLRDEVPLSSVIVRQSLDVSGGIAAAAESLAAKWRQRES